MRRQQEQKGITLNQYPPDGWLKGYFYLNDTDVIGGDRSHTRCWKNIDHLRLKDFALHLLDPSCGKKILDVGCADGALMVYCGLQGATVYGQDLDLERVLKANSYLQRFGIPGEARCGDARRLDFPDNSFDGAISGDFLEHISDEEKIEVLREVKRCLKPGAPLVVKTPNLRYLRLALLYKRIRAVCRFQNPMRYTISQGPRSDDPQHIGLTTRRQLTRCPRGAGFLNYTFHYAPLRRLGPLFLIEMLSVDVWGIRDFLCEEIFCRTWKPIILSHFPD